MRIAVTGSIATDHLMTYPGRFAESLVADRLDKVSLSFLVEDLDIRRGGVAANICFGMACLGLHPVLIGSVGDDFDDYRSWLERHGVDCAVRPGLGAAAHGAFPLHDRRGPEPDRVVLSRGDGRGTRDRARSHHREARRRRPRRRQPERPRGDGSPHRRVPPPRGLPFVADPSQQLSGMEDVQIRGLVDGAAYLFCNAYERALLEQKTGWSATTCSAGSAYG